MTSAYTLPPLPDAIDLDYDSGEGGRGGAIWHTTDALVAYAAPMAAEIARLQAQVADLQKMSVRNILLAIVPGDGSGQEIYAESVDDVVNTLAKIDEQNETLQAQVDAAKADASLMRSIHAQAMESNGRTIASHLGTIQDLRAQVDALAVALGDAMAQIRISPTLARHPETAEVLGRGAAALAAVGR